MYNCEIYSVQKNAIDTEAFNEKIDVIAQQLYARDIRVMFNTDIAPDAKVFSRVLSASQQSEQSPDYHIFVNALDTTNPSSFKSLFYNFIKASEDKIIPDKEHKDMKAKIKICSLGDLGNGYMGYCFQIYNSYYVVLPLASLTENEISYLIDKSIDIATRIFNSNNEDYPDGLIFVENTQKKKKKESFFKSFIPQKDDPKNIKIRKWIVIVALIAFLVAAGYLINDLIIQPYLNSQINSEIHDLAYNTTDDNDDSPAPSTQNWEALKKINKEIVGWITIDKTKIDYPVLEHKGDNATSQYYLNHTYKKSYSTYGSVFVDYRCTDSVNSKNVILHGHNMQDGSMFKGLTGYGDLEGDLEFYKKHPVIKFNTPESDNIYKIISVFKTNTLYAHGEFFNYMQAEFLSDAEFMNFVYNCRVRSLINCPVMVNEQDQLLTLSTCSYEYSNFRTVVVARKLREGEKADVDVEIATLNKKPVFPDVYYQSRGGERPQVLTFKKANSKGLVTWYDGEGQLEGSETLTATVAANPTEPPTEKKDKKKKQSETQAVITYYEVKFVNWDGSEYYTASVKEGDSVELPGGTPGLPVDEYYDYTFTGWQTDGLDLNSVKYSMTIYPDFEATLK
ncbi:MAG: class B sortase [Ruminococcaceae bacterium]|nr:class B sortase [Oscillospiraceae bacterium]